MMKLLVFFLWRSRLADLDRLAVEGYRSHTIRLTHIFGRTSLDERSARRRAATYTTHINTGDYIPKFSSEFEPAILVTERPQTYALDRTATRIGQWHDQRVQ
jgi:hypothetical protein